MKTYLEQIAAFREDRGLKAARQKELMDDASEKGETLDEAGQEEFDTLQTEIEAIDSHLKRLQTVEKAARETAAPAAGGNAEEGAASRGGPTARIELKRTEK